MTMATIQNHRIVIVGGSGGVGKTSISAALAIASALEGHRTLVLTIDPARRLAAALGLASIGPEAVDITDKLPETTPARGGQLHAMMLDVQSTMDRIVERYAPSVERREAILNNRLYRNVSTRLSGSQEYAAMQRLAEIAASDQYDRVILDTPPSTHALDFLTAPQRLRALFDSSLIKLFLALGNRAGRGLFRMTDIVFRALERLTGSIVIKDISEFFVLAESILEPFNAQSEQADQILRDAGTSFLIVTGPDARQLDDAQTFQSRLKTMNINVGGMIVNRWTRPELDGIEIPDPTAQSDELAEEVLFWGRRLEQQAVAQTAAIDQLQQNLDASLVRIPEMDTDIHSIEGLMQIVDRLEQEVD